MALGSGLQILSCTNPTDGGEIVASQTVCFNTSPDPFTSLSAPTGFVGDLEYQWQISTSSPTFVDITGAVSETYTYGGTVTQTTWFRRLARVTCATDWVASNVVEVSVGPERVYVTVTGAGLMDGSSWANAMNGENLQTAINLSCDEVWVAAGTYKPTSGTDRNISFVMKNNLAIYGGFPSTGNPGMAERDWVANVTILSGDLNGDDGPNFANNDENSYHVIFNNDNGIDETAILDGFTISGGNANGSEILSRNGGGLYNYNFCSPTLTNIIFIDNKALVGGGMANFNNSNPALNNVSFVNNHATGEGYGGGMANFFDSSPTLRNTTFSDNIASNDGGGISNFNNSNPNLFNVVFIGNTAQNGGGIDNDNNCSPTLTNVTFSSNTANVGGGLRNISNSHPTLTNLIVWNNAGGEITNNVNSAPSVTYSIVQGGYSGAGNINLNPLFVDAANGNLRLQTCSPAINAGSNAAVPGDVTTDLDGNPRFYDGGIVDMGAYEFQGEKNVNPTDGGSIAANQTICYNTTPAAFSSSTLPTGHTGTLEYQWQISIASPTFVDIPGAASETYAYVGTVTQTTWFRRLARVTCETNWVSSNVVQVVVNPLPPDPATETPVAVCEGEYVILTATGSGTGHLRFYDNNFVLIADVPMAGVATQSFNAGPLTAGTYDYYITEFDGTCSSNPVSINATVNANPASPVAANAAICSGDNATLTATGSNIKWYSDAALTNLLATGSEYNTGALTATTDYFVTQTNAAGCESAAAHVTVTVEPLPEATAGGSATICESGSHQVSGANAEHGTISWAHNGSGSLSGETTLTPTYTPVAADAGNTITLTLTVTGTGQCGAATATAVYTIHVNPLPTASAGGSTTICENGSIEVSGASATNYSTISWTHNGSGSLSGETTLTPTYNAASGDAGNTVTLTLTVTGTGQCGAATATAVYTIHVNPLPTASAGGSATICENGSATVSGASATNYSTISWAHNGSGSLSGETTLTPTYNAASGDAGNTVALTLTVTSNNACAPATATAVYTIHVNPLPIASAGGSATICVNGSHQVSGASAEHGTISWTHNGSGSLSGETTLTPTYTPVAADAGNTITLTLTVTGTGQCGTATATAVYTIHVNPLPTASAGGSATICENGSATVSGASATNYSTISWAHNGSGSLSGETTLTPTYNAASGDAGNTVTLTLTVTGTGQCGAATATAVYTIHVNPLPTASAGGSATICENGSATVSGASATNYSTISWAHNGSGSLSDETTLTPTYNAASGDAGNTVTLTLTVTGTGQCGAATATAVYTIDVDPLTIAGTATNTQTICNGETPADLHLTGHTGNILKWQRSTDEAFTSPTDIAETTSTLAGATIGALTQTTWFHAEVQSGVCSPTFSTAVAVYVPARLLVTDPDGNPISSPKLQNIPFDIRVTLADADDNPVPAWAPMNIDLSASGGAIPGELKRQGFLSDPVTATLNQGETSILVENVLYSGLSFDGTDNLPVIISAQSNACSPDLSGSSNGFFVRGIVFTIEANPTNILADNISTSAITVTLTDADNPPAPVSNTLITVTTTLGGFTVDPSKPTSVQATTDANGQVILNLQSGLVPGQVTVTAYCPGACPATATLVFTKARVINQTQQTGFDLISAAVAAAHPGDTLLISAGTYDDSVDTDGKALTLVPGNSAGTITITGSLTLGSGDVLEMEIFDANDFDKFIVHEDVQLGDALLKLSIPNNYEPAPGTTFQIIDYLSIDGEFSNKNFVSTANDKSFVIDYNGNSGAAVVLTNIRRLFKLEINAVGP
jgi:hypothetical protein